MSVVLLKMTEEDYNEAENKFDFSDAGEELLLEIRNKSSNLYSILSDNNRVGISLVEEGKRAYIYLFVDPQYRSKGIASESLKLCEKILVGSKTEQILTSYNSDNLIAKSFASKFGYRKKFASRYMEYSGSKYEVPELSIREYRIDDCEVAHRLSAEAFHKMRLSTECFPESVVEKLSEETRLHWSKTAKERLVYMNQEEIIGHARIVGNEIDSISVKSEYQGRGIGTNFVKYLCNRIISEGHKTVSLYCVVGNRAIAMYESLGFKEVYTAEFALKSVL